MNEVQAIKRMALAVDPAEHMRAASAACVAPNGGRKIDHLQLFCTLQHVDLVARDNGHDREDGAGRLPALRTTACMVMCHTAGDADFDRIVLALADQRSPVERGVAELDAVIDHRMK